VEFIYENKAYFATTTPLTGADLTKAENYTT
jgi:hypothetical protein